MFGLGFVAASRFNGLVYVPSHMGIVQTTGAIQVSGGGGIGGTTTYNITPAVPFGSGHFCCLMSSNYMSSATDGRIAGVSFNGVAALGHVEIHDSAFSPSIWYGFAGAGSAGADITLENNISGGQLYYNANIVERDDVDPSPLDGSPVTTSGHSATPTISLASIGQPREFIVTVLGGENNATDLITVPADYVQAYVESDGSIQVPCAAAYKEVSALGAQNAVYTYATARDFIACMAAFKLL